MDGKLQARTKMYNELEAVVNRWAAECDLTLVDYLGALELLKYNLLNGSVPPPPPATNGEQNEHHN